MTEWTPKNNRTPWVLLTAEERKAMKECGGPWESWDGQNWLTINGQPSWDCENVYRQVVDTPISITPETLAVLPDWVQWFAADGDGSMFAYDAKPDAAVSHWWFDDTSFMRIDCLKGVSRGTVPWDQSLISREEIKRNNGGRE